jgi:hypothetical protein
LRKIINDAPKLFYCRFPEINSEGYPFVFDATGDDNLSGKETEAVVLLPPGKTLLDYQIHIMENPFPGKRN